MIYCLTISIQPGYDDLQPVGGGCLVAKLRDVVEENLDLLECDLTAE